MGRNTFRASVRTALAFTGLLLTAGVASAQVTVNLTATRQAALMPDGNSVPMWGWYCNNPVVAPATTATTAVPGGGTCGTLRGMPQTPGSTAGAAGAVWQPPLITVPTGSSLTINLTNSLPVETSLTIMGQLPFGSLGSPVRESSARTHNAQTSTTWTTVITPNQPFTPPGQAERVRSFVPEAAPNGAQTYKWSALKPGTYLIETGTYPSIQGPMGLYGVLVVTQAPTATAAGVAYPGVTYDADVPLLLSEIDPAQNTAADTAAQRTGFIETTPYSPNCAPAPVGNWLPTSTSLPCYPAAVNYTPLYYLINGVSFDATQLSLSQYVMGSAATPATASSGNVLLRFVNAGLHMHVPAVVGLPMQIYAQDGNVEPDIALAISKNLPRKPKTQSDVFMAAGKVYDILVSPPTTAGTTSYNAATFAIFDRQLSLSTNNLRDGGMQAYLVVNGGGASGPTQATAQAVADNFIVPVGGTTFTGNVLLNDIGIHNAAQNGTCGTAATPTPSTAPQSFPATPAGSVTLNPNGTFTFTPGAGFTNGAQATFTYCANGNASLFATVTLTAAAVGSAPTANADSYTTNVSSVINVLAPGVLLNDTDPTGYPLQAVCPTGGTNCSSGNLTVTLKPDGSFTAQPTTPITATTPLSFSYVAVNSQGTRSAPTSVTINFQAGSGLKVTVLDAKTKSAITDYKWIIEKDPTLYIDPKCQVNVGPTGTPPPGCAKAPNGIPPTLGTNFHASYVPVIAAGCTGPQSCERGQTVYDANPTSPTFGQHVPATCAGGICVPAQSTSYLPTSTPDQVALPATNPDGSPARYYISVLPGDAANSFNTGNASDPTVAGNCVPGTTPTGQSVASNCGHTMGGAPVNSVCTTTGTTATCVLPTSVTVSVEPNPVPTATLSVYVFQDDNELNGEIDAEPGAEPGLGDFQIELWDVAGSTGDAIGQMTYDMFNEPLTNALNGTKDPITGLDACPISNTGGVAIGVIIVCPHFESDGKTISPLEGQAMIRNLMPGRFSIIAHPGAAREAAGEEWVQTNTLDGSHFLDSFIRSGEPAYFQEYSPAGWHVFMGFANPDLINKHLQGVCKGEFTVEGPIVANVIGPANEQDTDPFVHFTGKPIPCNNTIKGQITNLHISRPPDERLYDSGVYPEGDPRNRATLAHTTCFVSLGVLDSPDLAFTKCDADGNFKFTGIPDGDYSLTVFDQWLDQLMFEKEIVVAGGQTLDVGTYPVFSWQTHIWNRTYMDVGQKGAPVLDASGNLDPAASPGLIQVPSRVRFRDGKFSNSMLSDAGGNGYFNETFPLFNWYTVESDNTRFRPTGVHVVYDDGGPLDNSGPYAGVLNSKGIPDATGTPQLFPVPGNLRVPGAVYCSTADCSAENFSTLPNGGGPGGSTGRIDPGGVTVEGLQGFLGMNEVLDWGKIPYVAGENGGIRGHVVYSSTRPFDDPMLLFQNLWEPLVPRVTVNLYQEGTAPDGTVSLTLVDTTTTSSWDDWAQGFNPATGQPYMNCPGQDPADPFFNYTLAGATNFLNPTTPLPGNGLYKCYDGLHAFNQVQPAPYDGLYQFPGPFCASHPGGSFTTTLVPTPAVGELVGEGLADGEMLLEAAAEGAAPVRTIKCATVPNPALSVTPHTGAAPAVLPTGKYIVEVVPPPNYEIVKEEDKNILIGDNFIAPVTQQFAAISNIYIVPDQAVVNQYYNPSYTGPYTASNPYNPPYTCTSPTSCTFTASSTNNGNPTTNMDRTATGDFGPGGLIVQNTPCVGQMRIVPDYMSISPESGEVAPFAGALRPLCDRKEVVLEDQMQAQAEFFVWTKTPGATQFTGFILDDMSSEFDPNSPDFGEKWAVPNVPVSIRDPWGTEISRVYSDQWGIYNGLTYSTWQVNPPNPAGYAPNVMITCMNDPGPIPAPTGTTMITDPSFNPMYSDFCYENPFMPADVTYLDTPVVPVSAFAEGYNPPDCAYSDATPALLRVDGDGPGPWVSQAGHQLTITALGDQPVPDHAYSGPSATTSPYNQKFITRHYGFGATAGRVTIGGVPATVNGWSDTTLTVTVPANVPDCSTIQGEASGGALPPPNEDVQCGELVITAANGKQSVDTVTVTVGGKAPTVVNGENAANNAIQTAIDNAAPGDLIIVNGTVTPTATAPAGTACGNVPTATCVAGAATYNEMLLMWKPVRLQGVGAASVVVNANAHPAGKLTAWRAQVDCLFGLNNNGYIISATNPASPGCSPAQQGMSDPIPDENLIGWDANVNGFAAEILQEPTLMGALEGAAITAVGKAYRTRTFDTSSGTFTGPLLTNGSTPGDCDPTKYPGNFLCAPSRIDGMTFTNSSAGGGGVFVHGWNHYLHISNNRVYGNGGSVTGGITVGMLEVPSAAVVGHALTPYKYNTYVSIHHNSITANASFGDEFNTDTPAAGGGATFCSGSDYYRFNYNWVCGNMSTGDGGGVAHYGLSFEGLIAHNQILFNQSFNQTLPTHGGGIAIQGEPQPPACEGPPVDLGCPPALSDGTGNVRINANLIQGNTAEAGSGGGIRVQNANGADVANNPNNTMPTAANGLQEWWRINITNNIVVDNVAGWAGGGISLVDAVNTRIVNNTVSHNDSTSSAGVEFDTVGANQGTIPPNPYGQGSCGTAQCSIANPVTTSNFQAAGVVSEAHGPLLAAAFANPFTGHCPFSNFGNTSCNKFSNPLLTNDIISQNRAFHITVANSPIAGAQNVVSLIPTLSQTTTGQCATGANYWDIGIVGDTQPTAANGSASGPPAAGSNPGGYRLNPRYSILDDPGYAGNGNINADPQPVAKYCNGSRVPPEIVASICASNANAKGCSSGGQTGGFGVPPGIPDIDPFYPLFVLTPAATVDEGNNFINMFYGPLSLSNATTYSTPGTALAPLGNYSPAAGSPAINAIPITAQSYYSAAPARDFFGNPRPDLGNSLAIDIGAVEVQQAPSAIGQALGVIGGGLGTVTISTPSPALNPLAGGTTTGVVTVSNIGTGPVTLAAVSPFAVAQLTGTGTFATIAPSTGTPCAASLVVAAGGSCTIGIRYAPPATPASATSTANLIVTVTGAALPITGAAFTGT